MRAVNLRELHLRTGAIIDRVAKGDVIQILRRGTPVAEIRPAPATPGKPLPDRERILAKFPRLRSDSGRFLEQDRS